MAVPTRTEIEAMIAENVANDPTYRDRLLADPRGVVGELLGMDLPPSISVILHEESLTHIHLTIPATDALSEDDLELVAGGCWSHCQSDCDT
jgi:hypothetical protein